MTWTLYKYLAKDLAKTAFLATTALTLLLTVIGIIEPLQEQGLAPSQVLALFWYLVPVMLSLTLPIAALFSATFIYGRFSMDNEFTAAKSGGVSVYTLLKPALVMGVMVSAATLALSNWVAPELARRGEETARADMQRMVYRTLKARTNLRIGKVLVHADGTFLEVQERDGQDEEVLRLQGVVAVNMADPTNAEYAVASGAYIHFGQDNGATEVGCSLVNPSLGRQNGFDSYLAAQVPFVPPPMDSLLKEDPAFHDWRELAAILRDPCKSSQVRHRLTQIYRQVHAVRLYEDIADDVTNGRPYRLYDSGKGKDRLCYEFSPSGAVVHKPKPTKQRKSDSGSSRLRLFGKAKQAVPADPRPVYVTCRSADGQILRRFKSHEVTIRAQYLLKEGKFAIRVDFHDVIVNPGPEENHRGEFTVTALEMPSDPHLASVGEVSRADLESLYRHPNQYPGVSAKLRGLDKFIQKLTLKIVAEMHGRIAYGLGCFLLVATGSALGLIFRGGHMLSAFALSCLPALVLLVLMIMGKQMVSNPDASREWGLASIWAGVGLVGLMTTYLYGVVLRR